MGLFVQTYRYRTFRQAVFSDDDIGTDVDAADAADADAADAADAADDDFDVATADADADMPDAAGCFVCGFC